MAIELAKLNLPMLRFGTAVEDKQRRLRAFLSLMGADNPLMLQVHSAFENDYDDCIVGCRPPTCPSTCC